MQHNPRTTESNGFRTCMITIIEHLPFPTIDNVDLCRFWLLLNRQWWCYIVLHRGYGGVTSGKKVNGGDEGHLGWLNKSSSFWMNGKGSCDGGDGTKSGSKSRTGRSSSNGLEEIPVSLSLYLAIPSWTLGISFTSLLNSWISSAIPLLQVSFLLSRSRKIAWCERELA